MSEEASSPLPLAGGAGGGRGRFKPRDTDRARDLRNTASPAERRLWSILARRALSGYKFSRQMPIGPYFADFLCREAKLVVEVDGYSHDLQLEHDARRDAYMTAQGYKALRFTNEEVMANLDGVAHAIVQSLTSRCPPPTPPASGRGEDVPQASNASANGELGTPLPFRGGAGGGASPYPDSPAAPPHPNPSPEGEGLGSCSGSALVER
jgi:very-short-patch-repair endonuclease